MAKKINKKTDAANIKALFVCLFGLPLVIGYGIYVMLCNAKASMSRAAKTMPLPTAKTQPPPSSARVTEVCIDDRWVSIVAVPVKESANVATPVTEVYIDDRWVSIVAVAVEVPAVPVIAEQPKLLTYKPPTLLLTYVPQVKDESAVLVPDMKTIRLKQVKELLAKGMTKTAAAKELKVSPTTLRRWLQAA